MSPFCGSRRGGQGSTYAAPTRTLETTLFVLLEMTETVPLSKFDQ